MLGSFILETAIGLAALFLLVALVTTVLQEFLASIFKLRGRVLRVGLTELLSGQSVRGVARLRQLAMNWQSANTGQNFAPKVLRHPLVTSGSVYPSYVSAPAVAAAMLDVTAEDWHVPATYQSLRYTVRNPGDYLQRLLHPMFEEPWGTLADVEDQLAKWVAAGIDRITGQYKRLSGWISLAIAALLAFSLQINALAVAQALWSDAAIRQKLDFLKINIEWDKEYGEYIKGQLFDSAYQSLNTLSDLKISDVASYLHHFCQHAAHGSFWLGCAITAAAASFAAPVWFSFLQKLVDFRGAGAEPSKAEATTAAAESLGSTIRGAVPLIATATVAATVVATGTLALSNPTVRLDPNSTVQLKPTTVRLEPTTLRLNPPTLNLDPSALKTISVKLEAGSQVTLAPNPTVTVAPPAFKLELPQVDIQNLKLPSLSINAQLVSEDLKKELDAIDAHLRQLSPQITGRGSIDRLSR